MAHDPLASPQSDHSSRLISSVVDDYLKYVQFELGLTKTTFMSYRCYLRRFLAWCAANGTPEPTVGDFSTPLLRKYMYSLAATVRPRTVRGAFHPLKGMSNYMVGQDIVESNPCATITLPKKDAAQRLLVTDQEVTEMLAASLRQRNVRRSALSRAIISVLVYGALRRQELLDLHVGDVRFDDGSILVRSGKGRKSRMIFPCQDCLEAISKWLCVRGDCSHDWLWARDASFRMNDTGLHSLIEDVKAIGGLADHNNIKPHSLRHNCATRLMRNGADIRSIQAFLGHSEMRSTSIYLHTDTEQLRAISELGALVPRKVEKVGVVERVEEEVSAVASDSSADERRRFRETFFRRRRTAR